MPCIKVGVNEWAIIDRSKYYNFSLWTAGLNDYVAVAIVTDCYAFLTHISSKMSLYQWDYEASINFLIALRKLGPLSSNAMCEVVLGGSDETTLSWAVYQTIYTKWKDSKAATNSEPKMSYPYKGIRILYPSLNNFETLKNIDHKVEWGKNKNTITGSEYLQYQGFLNEKGQPADIPS